MTRSRMSSPASITSRASVSAVAAPPMSFFIRSIALDGLMSSPPVSNTTPLPTSVTLGASRRPQMKSASRGGSAAAAPTAWTSGKLRAIRASPTMLSYSAPLTSASRAASSSSAEGVITLAGALIRSRPNAIARAWRSRLAKSTFAGGSSRGCGAALGLEPDVAIEPKQEAERRELGVLRRIGETVVAGGQARGELAGAERLVLGIVRRRFAEEDAGERAVGVGEKLDAARFRLEAARVGEPPGDLADFAAHVVPGFVVDEPDRRDVRGCVQLAELPKILRICLPG